MTIYYKNMKGEISDDTARLFAALDRAELAVMDAVDNARFELEKLKDQIPGGLS